MSQSYWVSVLAAVGLILTVSLHAEARGHADHRPAALGKTAAPIAANSQLVIPTIVQTDLDRIANALEAANSYSEGPAEKKDTQENLQAQRDMARAADRMFWIGLVEIVLTSIGVILIALTFRATKRGAEAAQNSFKAMVRIERPYLMGDNFFIGPLPTPPTGNMWPNDLLLNVYGCVANVGSRLGLVNGFGVAQCIGKPPLPPVKPRGESNFSPYTVAPDSERTWEHPLAVLHVSGETLKKVFTKEEWYFYGYFLYTDAQHINRRAGFVFSGFYNGETNRLFLPISDPAEYWYDEELSDS